ncbi:MAG: M23 family metallopeptidase [Terricaulis sp.]
MAGLPPRQIRRHSLAMARFCLIAALVFVAACANAPPAPVAYGGAREAPASPSAVAPRVIAEDTPLAAYGLRPEDAHPVDPARTPRTHHVGADETLYDIATRYQIPMLALIGQNGLEPPYALIPGREIELPPPRFHVAQAGENFVAIAERYSVDPRSLALLNRVSLPHNPRPGERIVLPAMASDRAAPPTPAPETRAHAPPQVRGTRFRWPLRGNLAARFGAQAGGGRLDGIEIAGREGAAIAAAAEGDVVYAGADLSAYGTLVLVRHADNYVTAYGYARRALVREGQHVRAGQALAELGVRHGGARLLFQVRRGREALDPLPLMEAP